MEVLTSKPLIDSNIIHDEFVLIINVLKEYEEIKEEIGYLLFKQSHNIVL